MVHFIGPEGSLNFILQPLSDPILLAEVLLAMLVALAVMLLSEIKGLPLRENLESVRESVERIRVVIGSYLRLTLGMFLLGEGSSVNGQSGKEKNLSGNVQGLFFNLLRLIISKYLRQREI